MTNDPFFQAYDYPIGGKMVIGRATISEEFSIQMKWDQAARDKVKIQLVHQMAEYILENKLAEFTYYDSPEGDRHMAVRAYLAPSAEVRILRLANKI